MNWDTARWTRAALIVLVLVGSLVVIQLKEPILGLDLRGGVMMLLEAQTDRLEETDLTQAEAMDRIVDTIRFRVDQTGLAETTVTQAGNRRVWVEIPCPATGSCEQPRQLRNLIERRGFLVFKEVVNAAPSRDSLSPSPTQEIVGPYTAGGREEFLVVPQEPLMTGAEIESTSAQASQPGGGATSPYVVQLTFTDDGAREFQQYLTDGTLQVDDRLAIILDGAVQSAPRISQGIVNEAQSGWRSIKGGTSITGLSSIDEARNLSIVLRSGNLPIPVRVIQENTIGPNIGQDSIDSGVFATVLAAVLILLFMVVYYRLAGVIADLTILLNVLVLVAAMMLLDATWTLPGIAGLILTIGIGVDNNVLIFERVREELRSGKTVRASIDYGYDRAIWTIVDSNVTALVTALILFTFGTGPIQGFATTLSIGLVINLFTALAGTRLAFDVIKDSEPRRLSI